MADMKYRKLRIAWSVAWGILCLLLIVLIVRSYSKKEYIFNTDGTGWITTFGFNSGEACAGNFTAQEHGCV
jgi:hypothetical protein